MTQRIQAGGVVKIDNASGTLVDISAYVRTCAIDPTITRQGYHVLSSRHQQQPVGNVPLAEMVTLECIKTDDATGAYATFAAWYTGTDNLRSFEAYDPDAAVGSDKWAGEVSLNKFGPVVSKKADGGEIEVFNVELAVSGGLTNSTVAGT